LKVTFEKVFGGTELY